MDAFATKGMNKFGMNKLWEKRPTTYRVSMNTHHGAVSIVLGVENKNRIAAIKPPFVLFSHARNSGDDLTFQRMDVKQEHKKHHCQRKSIGVCIRQNFT